MITSTSHHHKGIPSQAERIQSTLLGLARATHGGYPGDWKDMLPFLLFSIRATPSRVTKASPAELLYGRPLKPPYPALKLGRMPYADQGKGFVNHNSPCDPLRPYNLAMIRRLRLAWDHARAATQKVQLYNKAQYDSHHQMAAPFKTGDLVMIYEPDAAKTTNKLTRGLAWYGPCRVESVLSYNNVKVKAQEPASVERNSRRPTATCARGKGD